MESVRMGNTFFEGVPQFLVRLAAHASNGSKSQIRPVAGRI